MPNIRQSARLRSFVQVAIGLIGVAACGYLLYQALHDQSPERLPGAFGYFGFAILCLVLSVTLISGVESFGNMEQASAKFGCYAKTTDYKSIGTGWTWTEHYLVRPMFFDRPSQGYQKQDVFCNVCGRTVSIQLWSLSYALRLRLCAVGLFTAYGLWWMFLIHVWPCIREDIPLLGFLVMPVAFAGAVSLLLVPSFIFTFIMSPWADSVNGISSITGGLLRDEKLEYYHKLFWLN